MEKNPTIFKIGDFLEKKIKISTCSRNFFEKKNKIPPGSTHFFWNHERSEVLPASLARSVLKPCALEPWETMSPRLVFHVLFWSRVHLSRSHLTTTPLSWQPPRSGGNEFPPYLPPSLPKNVLWFFFYIEINFRWFFFCKFSKIFEKHFLSEKNPTSSFKIGGFCSRKMFFKFA